MKNELTVALEMKEKGFHHVIQITTTKYNKLSNFGEPLYIKSADEAGPLLRSFKEYEHAKISWSKSIDDHIRTLRRTTI